MLSKKEQIAQTHAELILAVVAATQNPEARQQLEQPLRVSEDNGWVELVRRIRRVLEGERDASLLLGLDEEDHAIVESILEGIQDPSRLPKPGEKGDAGMAAPGLAQMIHAAAHGNTQALQLVANMAEQMTQAGGSMAQIGGIIRKLINGERDADKLAAGMNAQAESLLLSILQELAKLEAH
ncbi:MAG: hypothetical protein ACPG4N_09780 [Gammaproteobacteria bacterium]